MAKYMGEEGVVEARHDTDNARWIVSHPDGSHAIMGEDAFAQRYTLYVGADELAPAPIGKRQSTRHIDTLGDSVPKPPKKTGRPTKYTAKLAHKICMHIINRKSLRKIAAMPDMPAMSTIWKWVCEVPEFSKQYAQARAFQAELFVDDIVETVDDASGDYQDVIKEEGVTVRVADLEHINRARLKFDGYRFLMTKMSPRYNDKLDVNHNGKVEMEVGVGDLIAKARAAGLAGQATPADANGDEGA